MCNIGLKEKKERLRKMHSIFHLLLQHHYDNVLCLQAPVTDAARCFSGTTCAVLSCQVVSGCTQAAVTSRGKPAWPPTLGISQVT